MSVPLAAQIAEVRREIAQREHVFPRWVEEGRLTAATADRRLEALRAALISLQSIDRPGRLI